MLDQIIDKGNDILAATFTGDANLGLEDYANDTFTTYSNSLYNFEQVRRGMDFIRGKSVRHGNVKIKNFLNALIQECTERA